MPSNMLSVEIVRCDRPDFPAAAHFDHFVADQLRRLFNTNVCVCFGNTTRVVSTPPGVTAAEIQMLLENVYWEAFCAYGWKAYEDKTERAPIFEAVKPLQ